MAGRRNRPWYKRYPSNFLAGTRGMRPLLFKTYSRLIDGTYEYGGPLPNDPTWLAHLLELRVADVPRLLDELTAKGKITVEDGLIHNGRADKEFEEMNAHLRSSESQVSPQWSPNETQVDFNWEPDRPKKGNGNYARTRRRPHDHAHPRTEAEAERKGSAPYRAESPSSFKDIALPPREVGAPGLLAGRAPPTPDAEPITARDGGEAEPHRHEPVIERTIPQERWNELRQSLGGGPGSQFDPSKPAMEQQHAAEPDDRVEPAGDRRDQGELPQPAGTAQREPDPPQEPEAAAGDRGGAEPEAAERQAETTDESPLMRALRKGKKHDETDQH